MSQIKIKNFGPIKAGYADNNGLIDIKKVTVFIGNQGSGKSSVAKLISTMLWIEKALVRGDFKEKDLTIGKFQKQCLHHNIGHEFTEDTVIDYRGEAYHIFYILNKVGVFKHEQSRYLFPKIMYIPAERNFLSAVDRPTSLKNLPTSLYTFLDEFENAKQDLKGSLQLPFGNVKFEYHKLSKTSYVVGNDYKIRLSEASSGFQSFIPLYIVSRYLAYSIDKESDASVQPMSIEEARRIQKELETILTNKSISEEVKLASLELLSSKYKYSSFINIIEEPEQNLYPSSQRYSINSLLEFANMKEGNELIITTHSPYIINFLSIAIQGDYLKGKIAPSTRGTEGVKLLERLDKVVPIKSVINAKDVVVYQLDDVGNIQKLPNYEGIPSDDNYLNASLAEGNELFGSLLEIEQDYES